eukprot:760947-Hanusia_phi.AAC.5
MFIAVRGVLKVRDHNNYNNLCFSSQRRSTGTRSQKGRQSEEEEEEAGRGGSGRGASGIEICAPRPSDAPNSHGMKQLDPTPSHKLCTVYQQTHPYPPGLTPSTISDYLLRDDPITLPSYLSPPPPN